MANKLELTWVDKDKEIKIEPRILIENPNLSNTKKTSPVGQVSLFDAQSDNFENMLIHGDNLLALKALESKYAGQVKCIYIDPPYNTGSAFEHYDDNIEHSIWLSLMRERLQILYSLLHQNGSMWISIDDDERDYLKIICDEIFGRTNFVCSVIWQKKGTRSNDARWFSDTHDYILVYAKDKLNWKPNLLPRPEDSIKGYANPDNDPRGVWASGPCHAKTPNEKDIYEIITPSGRKLLPPPGTSWRFSKDRFEELIQDNRIWFGEKGDNVPRYKRFITEVQDGFVPTTLWLRDEVGDNQEAKKEVKQFNAQNVFSTPKPERLIQQILTLGSNKGDLVLDSFLGSGTTAAVAHKMGRKYIGIEMGNHAYTHCKVRLDNVISGTDKSGISKNQHWQGGGGYKFYELAPSLVVEDKLGNQIINKDYNADMLAAAMALHEGFNYQPDEACYWKQGKNEHAYIYTTTHHITADYIAAIVSEMQDSEYLIIACKTFDSGVDKLFKNITIKKIPQSLLGRCEFGKSDYNLNIIDVPTVEEEE